MIPFEIEVNDRIPKQRYFDDEFFALEAQRLWPRVWQMACRLEEIPDPFDCVEYEILDQSVIVLRDGDGTVRAFQNACRHRGVKLLEDRGRCESGFVCPFHGWCYGTDGANTFVSRSTAFSKENLKPDDIGLVPVRCETWGGSAWINLSDDAPPLRDCLEPVATVLDAWRLDEMQAEWWRAFRLPVNWKLAEEAFMEQYHVLETHPQLRIPNRYAPKRGAFDPQVFLAGEMEYLRQMSEGMAGMVHKNDVKIAEALAKTIELPADPALARAEWDRQMNDAVTAWHTKRKHPIPDMNELEAAGMNEPMGYAFPHYFVLPMYSSASAYRFRPIGPEETLMEIWSLTRYPSGKKRPKPTPPDVWEYNDPRVPPIPTQDFSNLPRQQRGLHTQGFEYMRLSEQIEGHISNFHRTIDGFLRGASNKKLVKAIHQLNLNPLERPVVDLKL